MSEGTENAGFSNKFVTDVSGTVFGVAVDLLRGEGWTNWPNDVKFTHAEMEAEFDLEALRHEFEQWLDEQLNRFEPKKKADAADDDEDESDCDCVGPSHRRECRHWVLPN